MRQQYSIKYKPSGHYIPENISSIFVKDKSLAKKFSKYEAMNFIRERTECPINGPLYTIESVTLNREHSK